jgi:two-component system OmpR family response regulator
MLDSGSERVLVLVADDEPQVRDVLRHGLEEGGFAIAEASNKDELLSRLKSDPVQLITLDLGLGDEDGLELAREIRAERNLPIIMVTGRGEPLDRVKGLEYGADDYVAKPFDVREITIRVNNVLSRYGITSGGTAAASNSETHGGAQRYAFDHCIVDLAKREATDAAHELIDLTETEFRLLTLFLQNPARVLSRDDIWQALRGHDWSPLQRAIDGHIARLRRKIEGATDEPRLIKTVRHVGYVFTGEVRNA